MSGSTKARRPPYFSDPQSIVGLPERSSTICHSNSMLCRSLFSKFLGIPQEAGLLLS